MNLNRPSQKNQPSRKGKKAWRKNIDLDDLEEGIEEARNLQRVIGVSALDARDGGELFQVDTAGDENIEKKTLKETKRLKADEILARRSAIPGLDLAKKPKNKVQGVSKKEMHRLLRVAGRVDAKNGVSALANIEKHGLNKGGDYDLWGAEDTVSKKELTDDKTSFISTLKPALSHHRATTTPKTLTMAPMGIVEKAEAVPLPDPGRSYNPSIEAWKALIQQEHDKEEVREQERLELVEKQRRIELAMASMDDGEDFKPDENMEEENVTENLTRLSANKPVEEKRKTTAQRNKEKRYKERVKLEAELKELKQQIRSIESLPALLKNEEAKLALEAAKQEKNMTKRRKLGSKYSLPEAPLDVKLSDELTDCLRKLRPEGNLAKDAFRSLQERGIIEVRVPVSRQRRYKRKTTEKWAYKDIIL